MWYDVVGAEIVLRGIVLRIVVRPGSRRGREQSRNTVGAAVTSGNLSLFPFPHPSNLLYLPHPVQTPTYPLSTRPARIRHPELLSKVNLAWQQRTARCSVDSKRQTIQSPAVRPQAASCNRLLGTAAVLWVSELNSASSTRRRGPPSAVVRNTDRLRTSEMPLSFSCGESLEEADTSIDAAPMSSISDSAAADAVRVSCTEL